MKEKQFILNCNKLYFTYKVFLDQIDPYEKNSWVENKLIEFTNHNGGHWDEKKAGMYFNKLRSEVTKPHSLKRFKYK